MADSTSIVLAVVLGGILLLCVRHFSYGWRGPSKSGARLPKGSFGWPIIGETFAFAMEPTRFATSHIKRYGTVFKTNIFLQPTIVGSTPQFAKFILGNSHIFHQGYASNMRVAGPKAFSFREGPPHGDVKMLVQKAIRADSLISEVNAVERIVLDNLASCVQQGTVVGLHASRLITLETSFWFLIRAEGMRSTPEGRKALDDFKLLSLSTVSLPLNFPGTNYRRGMKAKADLTAFLEPILQQRKGQEKQQNDVLGNLLTAHEGDEVREGLKDLDDERIADSIVATLFAAYESSATNLTWILKSLIDHPDVFRRIQAEHQEILKAKGPSVEGPRLVWEDMKKMEYTSRFLQEVQRIVSIAFWMPRKVTQDVEYEGHLIPKGWTVSLISSALHSDPALFPDPQTFDPDRFNFAPKPYTYLPFGSGGRLCPGADVTKLVSLIFIHHIVTTFSYESAGPDLGVEYNGLKLPVGGFPINIKRATKSS